MKRIGRNVSVIFRAERLIAQRRLDVMRRQTGMMAAAGIAAGIGLIALNGAAYLAMSQSLSPALSALIVAMVNIVLALVIAQVASKANAESEIASVAEVRDIAVDDLEAEFQEAVEEVQELSQSLRKMAKDPLGTLAPGALAAAASVLIKNVKK